MIVKILDWIVLILSYWTVSEFEKTVKINMNVKINLETIFQDYSQTCSCCSLYEMRVLHNVITFFFFTEYKLNLTARRFYSCFSFQVQ